MIKVEDDMRRNSPGIKVNVHEIYELRYADDTALLSHTREGLITLI